MKLAPADLPPAPRRARDRLWLAGFSLALFLVTVGVTSHLAGPETSLFGGKIGDDLIPSYMAGTFVREGRADLLMDLHEARRFQAHLRRVEGLEQHGRTGPWLNPPYYAPLFVPLSALPYHAALYAWAAFNLLLLAAAVVLLCRMLPRDDSGGGWKARAIVPVAIVCSMPLLQSVACQQNTFLSLLLLAATAALWKSGRRCRRAS